MKKRIECIITGRVQMVFYRDFAQRKARALGFFGFVKNNEDGSVLVIAEGEEEKLKAFIGFLKKGPVFSRVDKVEIFWKDATGEFSNFEIRF